MNSSVRQRLLLASALVFVVLMGGLYLSALDADDPPPVAGLSVPAPKPRAAVKPVVQPPPPVRAPDPTPRPEPTPEDTPEEVILEPSTPSQELATITGTVHDSQGRPLPRVNVILEGPRKMRIKTDEEGYFTAPNVPAGTLVAWAERRDGALSVPSAKQGIEMEDGGTYELEFVLPAEKVGGLGINLRPHPEGVKVSNAIVGGQGDYIGLGKNDVILEVNGVEVLGHSMSEVASMIKGPEGSSGTLLIRRNGSDVEEELSFEREFVDKVRRRPR